MKKLAYGFVVLAAGSLLALQAQAAVTTYTDRAAFTADTGASTIEDFTDAPHFPIPGGQLNSTTSFGSLNAGDILAGVTYSTPNTGGNYFNIDAGGGFSGGFLDTVNGPAFLTATFDGPQFAFGFNTNSLVRGLTVTIFNSTSQIFTQSYAQPAGMVFFGFASSAGDIKSVTIGTSSPGTFGFAIDNFTFNGTTAPGAGAVPEPATWAMMILGFGAAGSALRRRKAIAA